MDPLDVKKKMEALEEKRNTLLTELDTQIKVSNVDERLLLRYRYLDNHSWEEIGVLLNASVRTVHRIHSSALQNFSVPE